METNAYFRWVWHCFSVSGNRVWLQAHAYKVVLHGEVKITGHITSLPSARKKNIPVLTLLASFMFGARGHPRLRKIVYKVIWSKPSLTNRAGSESVASWALEDASPHRLCSSSWRGHCGLGVRGHEQVCVAGVERLCWEVVGGVGVTDGSLRGSRCGAPRAGRSRRSPPPHAAFSPPSDWQQLRRLSSQSAALAATLQQLETST